MGDAMQITVTEGIIDQNASAYKIVKQFVHDTAHVNDEHGQNDGQAGVDTSGSYRYGLVDRIRMAKRFLAMTQHNWQLLHCAMVAYTMLKQYLDMIESRNKLKFPGAVLGGPVYSIAMRQMALRVLNVLPMLKRKLEECKAGCGEFDWSRVDDAIKCTVEEVELVPSWSTVPTGAAIMTAVDVAAIAELAVHGLGHVTGGATTLIKVAMYKDRCIQRKSCCRELSWAWKFCMLPMIGQHDTVLNNNPVESNNIATMVIGGTSQM